MLTQAQQNKLLAIRPQPKPIDSRLMYMDDDNNNSDEQADDADDEEETIPKVKPKSFRYEKRYDFLERVMLCSTKR
ncbi:MAG: hypothetical protein EZS28_010243 [Streblomastix strix]|uniref:Uncharacterized protein n=1 Tax=Streblomastix strix TaxID=222440 RepID=A0A5J4WGX7_9EUKA|nr:MAG: hypothetical protein EZS28_010243 [Streblomastix strix]